MIRRNLLAAIAASTCVLAGKSFGQTTTASPKNPNRAAIAEQNVKQLLLLMDTDKNGRISKEEWMDFMSKEFDRLDTDKSGELDPKELLQSPFQVRNASPEVQGK
jgi:Ca2+-binding EF-hand superfamily protein